MNDRPTEPAPPPMDPDGVTPTTRHQLLWEALRGIQRIERAIERIESWRALDHNEAQRTARRMTELEGRIDEMERRATQ